MAAEICTLRLNLSLDLMQTTFQMHSLDAEYPCINICNLELRILDHNILHCFNNCKTAVIFSMHSAEVENVLHRFCYQDNTNMVIIYQDIITNMSK